MDKYDYPEETSTSPEGQEKLTLQETARERTEELLQKAGLDPEIFYTNFEFTDRMLQALLYKVGTGFHMLKTSFPGNDTILIIKNEIGETQVSTNVSGFATHLSIGMMVRPSFGLELRSYFNGGASDPESLTSDTHQELRGWLVEGAALKPLTSQQCIDVHCTDLATGKFLDPERNVAYCDGWELVEENQSDTNTSLN